VKISKEKLLEIIREQLEIRLEESLGPRDDHLESITSQDMADAKRYAKSDLPRDQADYLDISVEDLMITTKIDTWKIRWRLMTMMRILVKSWEAA
jgi:hypothetical protein